MTRVVRNPWPSFIGLGIRAATSAALGALLGSMAWGCSLLVDTTGLSSEADDLRRADSGGADVADDARGDAGANVEAGPCPSGRGPEMIRVETATGQAFCIDRTEVTQAHYAAFLVGTHGDAGGESAMCADNDVLTPVQGNESCPSGTYNPQSHPDDPVSCVNWCSAALFCKWAGKHLCGRVGRPAGDDSPPTSASDNEWVVACSRNGARTYPYGNAYEAGRCRDNVRTTGARPVAVGSSAGCEGGFPGLLDMSGNVYEWTDACRQGTACQARGGAFSDEPIDPSDPNAEVYDHLRCETRDVFHPSPYTAIKEIGFRCCGDAAH